MSWLTAKIGNILFNKWREVDFTDQQWTKANEYLRTFLPHKDVPRVNILVLGRVGQGKTSVMRTVYESMQSTKTADCIREPASIYLASHVSMQFSSKTKRFIEHRILCEVTEVGDQAHTYENAYENASIRMCDTMGLEDTTIGITTKDVEYIIEGNIMEKYEFQQMNKPIEETDPKFRANPKLENKMHCVAVVIEAQQVGPGVESLSGILGKLTTIIETLEKKGVVYYVLLTKIDEMCAATNNDLSYVVRSKTLERAVKKAATVLNIPEYRIFPIRNYKKNETKWNRDVEILTMYALESMLRNAKSYITAEMCPS